MNALVDFDQQIKRYDLTTRKADQKKADQYYQRFQEYLKALQQPLRNQHRDEGASDGGSHGRKYSNESTIFIQKKNTKNQ
jgi:hypothetical protein